jgi:hypothetical protein
MDGHAETGGGRVAVELKDELGRFGASLAKERRGDEDGQGDSFHRT